MTLADRRLESMHPTLEQELISIARRVQASHPDVPAAEVEAVVSEVADRYAAATIGHFLPILVERAARATLEGRGG